MTIAWTSASKGTLFAQVRGNLSTNTTTEKSAISNILPSKLKLAEPGLCSVLLVVYVVLYKNKQHSCHLCCCCSAGGHGVFVQSCAEGWLLLLSVCWACCQLAATGDWQQVHYTEQSRAKYYRMDTEYSSPPPLLCSLWLKS